MVFVAPAACLAFFALVAAPPWDNPDGMFRRGDDPENQVRKTDHEIERDAKRKPDGLGGFRENKKGFDVHVQPDGRVRFRDRNLRLRGGDHSGILFDFDVTDFAMRLAGQDPYQYEKTKYLERTSAERQVMAAKDRQRNIGRALADLPRLLAAVWEKVELDGAARRKVIFQLWDECSETGAPEIVRATALAREKIVAFIRARAPEGSPAAFSPAEIAGLNATRKAQTEFAPYR